MYAGLYQDLFKPVFGNDNFTVVSSHFSDSLSSEKSNYPLLESADSPTSHSQNLNASLQSHPNMWIEPVVDDFLDSTVYETPVIAVYPLYFLSNDPAFQFAAKGFSDALVENYLNSDQFRGVERQQIDIILDEYNFGKRERVEANRAAHFGRLLGADKVVIGSCQVFEGELVVTTRIVDVESGEIHKDSSVRIRGLLQNLFSLQEDLCKKTDMMLFRIFDL